jgi:regulator of sirC expression with transglutaminase-like and TPR domain
METLSARWCTVNRCYLPRVRIRADLTLFAHVVKRPDAELDLGQAALLIAEGDGPGVDIVEAVAKLDALGEAARASIGAAPRDDGENERALRRLLDFLYGTEKFRGNADDYYDPRNSYVDQVLERRVGIPISLAVVLLEVARRAGVTARGVSFPGHFLVRAPGARSPLFVDPFDGQLLPPAALRQLHARTTGEDRDPDPRLLEPVEKQQILVRMLNNLRGIWTQRMEAERLRGVLERLEILAPSAELRSQIEELGGEPVAPLGRGSTFKS